MNCSLWLSILVQKGFAVAFQSKWLRYSFILHEMHLPVWWYYWQLDVVEHLTTFYIFLYHCTNSCTKHVLFLVQEAFLIQIIVHKINILCTIIWMRNAPWSSFTFSISWLLRAITWEQNMTAKLAICWSLSILDH